MPVSPSEKSLQARVAVHESWANTPDPAARTAPARKASPGSIEYFERQVDPNGVLSEPERRRRAEHKMKAYFQRLALASARARRAGKSS
jgi:hypothetical protein